MYVRHHTKKGAVTSDYFRDYAEDKLEKLTRLPMNVSKVDVTTSKEGSFYTVDLCVRGKKEIRSSATTHDFMESLDRALDKALKQMTKLKLHSHQNRRTRMKSKRKVQEYNLDKMKVLVGDKAA